MLRRWFHGCSRMHTTPSRHADHARTATPLPQSPALTSRSISLHVRLRAMVSSSVTPCGSSSRSAGLKSSMNSRERGKHYRARLKLHQSRLVRHVAKLRRQLTDLKLLAMLQKRLVHSPIAVRRGAMKCLRDLLDENAATQRSLNPPATVDGSARSDDDCLTFGARSFLLYGPLEAPVLVLHGHLRGKLSGPTINKLYCCLPGNTALLNALVDKEVKFASTRSVYFGSDGSVRKELVETDYSTVLADLVPSLRGLSVVLEELTNAMR